MAPSEIGLVTNNTNRFMPNTKSSRIQSIDLLRGLVMIIMALDHVRDYFHFDAFFFDPMDLTQTTPLLFFTRFVTHFCAPVFIFLAGTSAFFVGQRKSKKELSIWLLKRGLWLVIAEFTILRFAWCFSLPTHGILLQVIWALGISMIFLAGFIHLPKKSMILTSLIAVFGHNLLDGIQPIGTFNIALWSFLHQFNIISISGFQLFIGYPIIPWIFVMLLGYYFGSWYTPNYPQEFRTNKLLKLGIITTVLFFALRGLNQYGDPLPWTVYNDTNLTILSFFNVNKYPPSLAYLLITMGPSFIFLSIAEKWNGLWTNRLAIIGRVPMFYYIVHIYVIHLFALFAALAMGFQASNMVIPVWIGQQTSLQGFGFSLGLVYLIWITLVVALYPLSKWYDQYKQSHRHIWWLTYI
ncbi:MAG: putative membrane protein [Bacteroidia bacterium]|jgi:uncharacterized membrane protein